MFDCERCWTVLQKIQCKTSTNVLWFGWMFMSSTVEGSVFMGKDYSDTLQSIKNTGENLTWKQMFEISEKLIFIFGQWWRSHQSLACKGLCIFGFCVMSWKGESEPNNKYYLGRTVELGQKFTTTQNLGHNRRKADGIRVEYFPGFTTLQLVQEVQKFMNNMSEPEQFQGRIIFMSMLMN